MRHSNARIHFSDILPFSPRGCCESQKWRSHPRRRSLFFVLGAFGARHIFGFCNTSPVRRLVLHMSVANVLLALRFFISSMHSGLIEHVSSNSNGQPRMILILFSRARFYNAMSLPPTSQQHFFLVCNDCVSAKMSFPRWRCREHQFCRSRPRCRSHFFVVPALVAVHEFGFHNPSNGILLVLLESTLCVTLGGVELRYRKNRRAYFARGV